MTGGSSGGPWFSAPALRLPELHQQLWLRHRSTKMYGPYWGSVIQQTYTTAAAS